MYYSENWLWVNCNTKTKIHKKPLSFVLPMHLAMLPDIRERAPDQQQQQKTKK
jgi:hypothetical protein